MSVRTVLIVGLALIFGGSAAVGVNLVAKQSGPPPDTVAVVTTAKDVARGAMLAADQLKLESYPRALVPPGAVLRLEDAIGRVNTHALVEGEPLQERKLAPKNAKGGLASLIPPGMRAFTILTPNVSSGVAGLILPGNKVDVLLTLNGDERSGGGVTTTLLQNVEILAVDTRLDAPSDVKTDLRTLQSVTLLVTPDQAAKLNLAQSRGTLHLSLRNPEDNQAALAKPVTLSGLMFYQEKPWSQQLKEVLEAYAKARAESPAAKVPTPVAEVEPPQFLEIRTLRGRFGGMVQLGPLEQGVSRR